uniref:Uncharacterized protein n=1 Tax=Noctiluca scintillans TaxID=2966 RepID=A0A7S1AXM5_NOCSC
MALPVWCLQWATLVFVSLDFDLEEVVKTKSHTTESILTTLKIMMIVVVQLNLFGRTLRCARSLVFVLVYANWADDSRVTPTDGTLFNVPLTLIYGKCVCGFFSVVAMLTKMGIVYATAMQSVSIILDSDNAPDVLFNCLAATFVAQIDELWWVTMSEVLQIDPTLEFPRTRGRNRIERDTEEEEEEPTPSVRFLRRCMPGRLFFAQVCVFVLYVRLVSVVFYAYHTDILPAARDVCTQWRWLSHQETNDFYFASVYRCISNFMFVMDPEDDIVQRADPSVGGYCTNKYQRMTFGQTFQTWQAYPVAYTLSIVMLFSLTVGPHMFPSLSKYVLKMAEDNNLYRRSSMTMSFATPRRRMAKSSSVVGFQQVTETVEQHHEQFAAETAGVREDLKSVQFELSQFSASQLLEMNTVQFEFSCLRSEVSTLKSEILDLRALQLAGPKQEPKDLSSTAELTTLTRGVQDLENFSEKMRNLHGVMELQVSRCVQELPELKSSVQELQEWKTLQEKMMGDTDRPHMPRQCDRIEGIEVQSERERLQSSEQETVSDQGQSADVGVTIECHITKDKSPISATRAVSPAVKLEARGAPREHVLVPLLAAKTVNLPSPRQCCKSECDSIMALDPPPMNPAPVGVTQSNSWCAQVYDERNDSRSTPRSIPQAHQGRHSAPLHPGTGKMAPLPRHMCGSLPSTGSSSWHEFSEERPLTRRLSPDRISGTPHGPPKARSYESPPLPVVSAPLAFPPREAAASYPGLATVLPGTDRFARSVSQTKPPQLFTSVRVESLRKFSGQSARTPPFERDVDHQDCSG